MLATGNCAPHVTPIRLLLVGDSRSRSVLFRHASKAKEPCGSLNPNLHVRRSLFAHETVHMLDVFLSFKPAGLSKNCVSRTAFRTMKVAWRQRKILHGGLPMLNRPYNL